MKADYSVSQLSRDDFSKWDTFVDASPQGDVFSYAWWLEAIVDDNFKILAVFDKDEIVAGIPLAYYYGKINEPPLTRTLGPLFKNLGAMPEHKQITFHRRWLNLLLDRIPLDEVEQFCTSHNFKDWLPFRWRGYKQTTRYTYLIDYSGKGEKDLWLGLNIGKKGDIKKAYRNGLKAEVTEDLLGFYQLVELTYQRQNLKFRFPYDSLKRLDDEIVKRDKRRIITILDENRRPHAAFYAVFSKKSAYGLLSGGDPQLRHQGGHVLAVWETIKYFRDKAACFNFGGSDIERIEFHLRGFGGVLTPYFHLFAEKPIIREVERIKEVEVIREVPVIKEVPVFRESPVGPPPDDWRHHFARMNHHAGALAGKAWRRLRPRPHEPIRVSVVSACYNHGKYVPEMLDSVGRQTFRNFEVIIVNDGSTDDSAHILNGLKDRRVRVIHTDNYGPSHARNAAIKRARGDLILNLDADDRIAPTFLQRCVEVMDARPDVGIVYSDVVHFGHQNGRFALPEFSLENMLISNCIVADACFRKSDWEKAGGYSRSMTHGYEDFDFWLSLLEQGRAVYKIEEPLVFYRTYEQLDECRSGRRKRDFHNTEEMIIRAFHRHRALYDKAPQIAKRLLCMEEHCRNAKAQRLGDLAAPLFSIITPTNRRPQLLERAIRSVQLQPFGNWEQIVVDDANDPDSAALIARLNEPRVKYVAHASPMGAGGAYNTGLRHARGRYINFLDDDDEYLPGILDKQLEAFDQAGPNVGFVWTGITRVKDTERGEELLYTISWPAEFNSRAQGLMISTGIGNGFGVSVKRECIEKIGYFDESLTVGEDTEFLIRLSKLYGFITIPEVLVKIHHHAHHQLTSGKNDEARQAGYQRLIRRHFDFLSSYWEPFHAHTKAYCALCYKLNKKMAGRRALWALIRKFPSRKMGWLELLSFELYGTDYVSSKLKLQVQASKRRFREMIGRLKSRGSSAPAGPCRS